MSPEDIARAAKYAKVYKDKGLQPLPSRPDDKRPYCNYAEYWESPAPDDLFERFPTTNIQVMTGRHWRLLVIDLDGPEAIERWPSMGRTPPTWVTHSGGGGQHLWFRLPANYPHKLPKAFLWRGDGKHSAIERLCDNSLVMAPPSIHPKTGKRYEFLTGRSFRSIGIPADCPDWVLRLPPLPSPKVVQDGNTTLRRSPLWSKTRGSVSLTDSDPITLCRSWGIRFTGHVSPKGWHECHAYDRPDAKPSAAVHGESGVYCDQGSCVKLSLAKLGVALNQFASVREALQSLGDRYVARR